MSKLTIFVSATIVAFFISGQAHASPQFQMPEPSAKDEPPSPWPDGPPDENLAITDPPPARGEPPAPPRPRYYPYHQALTFRAGQVSDFPDVELDGLVIGFQYLFPKFLAPKLEAGADLHENGRGHIHAGTRWIYFERSYFRPSVKLSFDHLMESKQGLATLTRLGNYYARASGTLEYVIWNPYSIRLEPELLVNLEHQILVVTLGVSRGW